MTRFAQLFFLISIVFLPTFLKGHTGTIVFEDHESIFIDDYPVSICEGETFSFGSQDLTIAGQYTEVFQTVNGYDSTVQITLTVNPNPVGSDDLITSGSNTVLNYDLQANINENGPLSSYFRWVATDNPEVEGESTIVKNTVIIDDLLVNLSGVQQTVVYTVTPVNVENEACEGEDFTITVTIDPVPYEIKYASVFCSDEALTGFIIDPDSEYTQGTTFTISVNNNGLTQVGGTPSGGSGKLQNEIIDDVWMNAGKVPVDVIYTIIPVSPGGDPGNEFTMVAIINPEPVGLPENFTVCSDQTLGFNIMTHGSSVEASAYTIMVYSNGLEFSGTSPSEGSDKPANELADDAWTNTKGYIDNVKYTLIPVSPSGCLGDPWDIIVTVEPEPVGLPDSFTVCSGEALGYSIMTDGSSVHAVAYNISVNSNGLEFSGTTPSEGSAKPANELADDVWTNITPYSVDVIYTIVPVGPSGCLGDPFDVTVTVEPEPVGIDESIYAYSTIGFNYELQVNIDDFGNALPASFIWSATNNSSVSGESTVSQNNSSINDVLVNSTTEIQRVFYTVIPRGKNIGECPGDPFIVTVNVYPAPAGKAETEEICSGDELNYDIQTSNIDRFGNGISSNYTYTVVSSDEVNVPSDGLDRTVASNDPITDSFINPTDNQVMITYTITPESTDTGLSGEPFTYTVIVNPVPDIIYTPEMQSVCDQENTNITLSTNSMPTRNVTFDYVISDLSGEISGYTSQTGVPNGYVINDNLRTISNQPQIIIYTLTPFYNRKCTGSPVEIEVAIKPSYHESITASICEGDVFSFGTQELTSAGEYTEIFQAVNGCDSTVTLSLSVNPSYDETITASICEGDVFSFGTQELSSAGEYTEIFQAVNGCDSTVTLSLSVNPSYDETITASICEGDVFSFGTQELTSAGEYTEIFQTVNGCDSTVTLTLDITSIDVSITKNNRTMEVPQLPGTSYQWIDCNDNNSFVEGANGSVFEVSGNGSYAVRIEHNNCIITTECIDISSVLNVDQSGLSTEIIVFPNPFEDNLLIDFGEIFSGYIEIYHINGIIIHEARIDEKDRVEIKLGKDLPGVYFIKTISNRGKTKGIKILKE